MKFLKIWDFKYRRVFLGGVGGVLAEGISRFEVWDMVRDLDIRDHWSGDEV